MLNERWQELVEQLDRIEEKRANRLDLELESCLRVMVRYLLEADRLNARPGIERARPYSPGSVLDTLKG